MNAQDDSSPESVQDGKKCQKAPSQVRAKKLMTPALFFTLTYFTIIASLCFASYREVVVRAEKNELAYSIKDKQVSLSDFVQFWVCGKLVLNPETRHRVYDPTAINQAMPVAVPVEDRIIPAVPFFIVLMAPWALMPVDQSFLLWIAASLLSMGAITALLLKDLRGGGTLSIAGFITAILAAQPTWFTVFIGHACLFQYLFIGLFFWGLLKKNDPIAGAGMALASFKPQYAVPLAMAALAGKRIKLLAWATAVEMLLLAMAVLTIGLDNTIHFPSLMAKYEHDQARVVPRMICLRAILETFLPHGPSMIISWLFYGAALLIGFLMWRQASKNIELARWAAAFTLVSSLLFSPHAHIYDAVMVGIAAIFILPPSGFAGFSKEKRPSPLKAWLGLIMACYPFLSWYFFAGLQIGPGNSLVGYPFAVLNGVILLFIMLIYKSEKNAGTEGEA